MPATRFRSVLLPLPLAPISETNSPRSTTSDASSSGVILCSPLTNDFVTNSTFSSDILFVARVFRGALSQCSILLRDAYPRAVLQILTAGSNKPVADRQPASYFNQLA